MNHEEIERWCRSVKWQVPVTRPDNPHSYTLKRNTDPQMFERVVEHIREHGFPYVWWGSTYIQYVAAGHIMWTMGAPVSETILVNRKSLEQVRLDEISNKGGGGIQLPWLHPGLPEERKRPDAPRPGQEGLF